jgi:hypothetical protein
MRLQRHKQNPFLMCDLLLPSLLSGQVKIVESEP